MLTNRENKIITDIMSGKMRQRKMLAVIIVAVVFLINLIGSFYIKNKITTTLEELFRSSNSLFIKLETKTPAEASLKSMVSDSNEELYKLMKTLAVRDINWRIILFASIIFMLILSFWISTYFKRIIEKLQKEKESKAK